MRKTVMNVMGGVFCAALVCSLVVFSGTASAAGFSETKKFSTDSLTVTNLIGEVRVIGHRGSGFEVVVDVQGDDASRDEVRIDTGSESLTVVFPKSKNYVYPNLDSHSSVSFQPNEGGSWLGSLMGSKIKVSKRGSGKEIWADIEIRVPEGGHLELRQGAGAVVAEDVSADLNLDSHHGKVSVHSIDGDLLVDTGSGDVSVAALRGGLNIDTGSGDVDVSDAECDEVVIDTGSGNVTLSGLSTEADISIDTGSGDISMTDISGDEFEIDTGSGDIDGKGIRAGSAVIDTGSGSVGFSLAEMGRGDFDIDTGSGGITLALPASAACEVDAEAGSGGVHVGLADVQHMRRHDDDEVEFTVGGGGARVTLESGSGAIRIIESK
jgi:DUF4097 and DUF4098 domain-containing protein YvlB